jgi:hydroxymethylpyrimidine/phosphomethylpyrimidine kinase
VRRQIEAVFAELPPAAAKTGMLYSEEIIRVVIACFRPRSRPPLVVDPVMISTSGARLLKSSAINLLKRQLLPLATLVTPNLPEAEALIDRRLKSIDDLRAAARELFERFGCAALVKGGHLRDSRNAVDIFFDGRRELVLKSKFIKRVSTHGTGCTFSAAIAAQLARGQSLARAVMSAKEHITEAIRQHQRIGGHTVLNSFGR